MLSRSPAAAASAPSPSPFSLRPDFLDRLTLALLALAIGSYFVVRGWLNAVLVIVGLLALARCVAQRDAVRRLLRQGDVRWMLLALAAPFLAVLVAALAHQELVPRYFDGPVRLLLAAVIMLSIAARQLDAGRIAGPAFAVAILLGAAMLFLLPSASVFFWEGRLATYFMDPLFLSQHVMIGAFVCLFSLKTPGQGPAAANALELVAIPAAVAVALGTQSRTGWLMVPVLLVIWLVRFRGGASARSVAVSVACVALACIAVYWSSGTVHSRIDVAMSDLQSYLDGTRRDSSVGIRLSLYRANWILFLQHPWTGWGYATMPDLKTLPAVAAFYTPVFESYFVHSGGHNEFLQAMMRMGTVGLLSRLLLFLVPLWVFARAARSADRTRRANGYFGLVVVIGYLTASASTEVINLIHAASFYALLVAVFAAGTIRRESP